MSHRDDWINFILISQITRTQAFEKRLGKEEKEKRRR